MTDKQLDNIATHPLQTSYWVKFREAWGNEILETKYGILTLHRIPKTKYKLGMFIKGPKPTKVMLQDLKRVGKEKNLILIKMEPNVGFRHSELDSESKSLRSRIGVPSNSAGRRDDMVRLLRENGAARGRTLFTPTTFQIDLTKSEDELLRSFNSKTRYNIRLAERKGVTVEEDNSDKAFDKYLDLMKRTVEHQRFYAHDTKYHKLMWESLNLKIKNTNSKVARLLVAKHNKKIITTWILFVWKDTLYYPYGARDERYNSLMANNLMMWETIKYGKNLKLKTFDLWGREPGKGFTKFKEGYNPEVIETLGTWDLVINKPLYYLYRGADMGRWMVLRGKSRFVVPRF